MKKQICALSMILMGFQQANADVVCGGSFAEFKAGVRAEAMSMGISTQAIDSTLSSVSSPTQSVLDADNSQGVFKMLFSEFARRVISNNRISTGNSLMNTNANIFSRAEQEFGVPREVITAFWGLETDFGQVQGDFNTVGALLTLAHDCRRPELFRPQVFGAMQLVERGDLNPGSTTGAWAGEIGQVQMLPNDIIKYGIDGDGDNHVMLKDSAADAIMSAANVLSAHGWQRNKPWVLEVQIGAEQINNYNLWLHSGLNSSRTMSDWEQVGVRLSQNHKYMPSGNDLASLVAPQGRFGPKFLVFANYKVFLKWNQSFTYTLSAAHFANMLTGNEWFDNGNPEEALSDDDVRALQTKLSSLGRDVGEIDGIIGGGTRSAVRYYQRKLGYVTDGWPTRALLNEISQL